MWFVSTQPPYGTFMPQSGRRPQHQTETIRSHRPSVSFTVNCESICTLPTPSVSATTRRDPPSRSGRVEDGRRLRGALPSRTQQQYHGAAICLGARGRSAASPSRRPALAGRCRSQRGCLPTRRVRHHGSPSAQGLPVRSRRYGLCGYRHVLRVPDRDARSFASS